MLDHELPYIFPDRDIVNSDAWNGILERMGLDFYTELVQVSVQGNSHVSGSG